MKIGRARVAAMMLLIVLGATALSLSLTYKTKTRFFDDPPVFGYIPIISGGTNPPPAHGPPHHFKAKGTLHGWLKFSGGTVKNANDRLAAVLIAYNASLPTSDPPQHIASGTHSPKYFLPPGLSPNVAQAQKMNGHKTNDWSYDYDVATSGYYLLVFCATEQDHNPLSSTKGDWFYVIYRLKVHI